MNNSSNEPYYSLNEIVNAAKLERILQNLSKTLGVSIGLLEYPSCNQIIGIEVTKACKNFHRSAKSNFIISCIENYNILFKQLSPKEDYVIIPCTFDLKSVLYPIILENQIIAVLLVGQVLFEKPDISKYEKFAEKFHFEKKEYIKQIESIPVIGKEGFDKCIKTVADIASMITESGLINKQLLVSEKQITKQNAKLKSEIQQKERIKKELEQERKNLENSVKEKTKQLQHSLDKLEETNLFLEEANQHRTKFLQTISHELRTPLNAIIGFCNLLEKQYYGNLNNKQLEYLGLISDGGNKLLSLINDVLEVATIDSGKTDMFFEETSLESEINNIIKLFSIPATEKCLSINFESHHSTDIVNIDKHKFRQILYNLISNACKYSEQGQEITIETNQENNQFFKVSVIDQGIGVSEEEKENIFSEFFQGNTNMNKYSTGLGIGLAITSRLVRMHNGEVGLESKKGKGAHFWFKLPLNNSA